MSLWHKHFWEQIDKTVSESAYEQITKAGQSLTKVSEARGIFSRVIVWTYRCRECGKLRIERQITP